HSTTAGVQIDNFTAGNAAEQAEDRPSSDERLLVTVCVDEHTSGARLQGYAIERFIGPLLERETSISHSTRGLLHFSAQQQRNVVAHSGVAAGFEKNDRQAMINQRLKRTQGLLSVAASFLQE